MKKVLFLDRDGTLIIEPEDYQIDSLNKLEFYPQVFRYLGKIYRELDYELVIVSNQDGLGTPLFPEKDFLPVQEKFIKSFHNEGILFSDILIDRSLPEDNSPGRKPGTAMLYRYLNGNYDLENSYVIGDRLSDIQLAENIGAKAIYISDKLDVVESSSDSFQFQTDKWSDIYHYLMRISRKGNIKRRTSETNIEVSINLDQAITSTIDTGIGFFDHMLQQISRHAGIQLDIKAIGDLEVDTHHTIEDVAICLGKAFEEALGKKSNIDRYGFCLPMDESLASVSIDLGGRSHLEWDVDFNQPNISGIPFDMFKHFFKSLSDNAGINLHISAKGENDHHIIESVFKAFARALKMAIKRDFNMNNPASTKGIL